MVNQDLENTSEDMEIDDDPEVLTKEILVFMEFDKKMKDYLFDTKIFFRMAKLEEKPLIQINNHIFNGEYRSSIGTNLFFSDSEKEEPENIFRGQGSVKLKHVATQFKTIILNPLRIPSDMADLPQPLHDIQIKKYNDTKLLLRKCANGSLNIKEDLAVISRKKKDETTNTSEEMDKNREKPQKQSKEERKSKPSNKNEKSTPKTIAKTNQQTNESVAITSSKIVNKEVTVDILTFKFEKLQKLALRPTRRRKEPDAVAKCEDKYKEAYDYNCLKSTVIKPSDYFRTISENFNDKTLVGAVDIDRSVLQGVIDPSPQLYRVLTEEEKLALLSIKNLENLSMAARYKVIKSHLDHLTSSVGSLSKDEKFEADNFGRTIKDTVKIYKRLVRVLGGIVTQKYRYDSDVEDD